MDDSNDNSHWSVGHLQRDLLAVKVSLTITTPQNANLKIANQILIWFGLGEFELDDSNNTSNLYVTMSA